MEDIEINHSTKMLMNNPAVKLDASQQSARRIILVGVY